MATKPPRAGKASGKVEIKRSGPKLTTTQRGYGWAWQQIRKAALNDEPLCRTCKQEGRTTPADEVDHIDGDSHNNDRANLRPLCRPCHLKRTAKDQAFKRKAPGGT